MGDNFDKKYCEAPDKIGLETKEKYEKYLRDESTQIIFKDFNFINEIEAPPSSSISKPLEKIKIIKKETIKDMKENTLSKEITSISSTNLISKNHINNLSTTSLKPSIGIGGLTSELNKFKVEKSPGILDNKLSLKPKKHSNSLSTSSLLKQYKQITNLSKSGNSIIGSTSNLSQHKRSGSISSAKSNYN